MKTNKEKAIDLAIDISYDNISKEKDGMLSRVQLNKVVNLAATPDWYFIEDDIYPEYGELFINERGEPCKMLVNFKYKNLINNKTNLIDNIKAWVYLPQYKIIKKL